MAKKKTPAEFRVPRIVRTHTSYELAKVKGRLVVRKKSRGPGKKGGV
jgi:hypothetical protein